ncbi:MAG: hypothetical protein Q9167_007512 [Letrouitia subvulpina]
MGSRKASASASVNNDPPSERVETTSLSTSRAIVLISALNATVTVGAINTGMLTALLPNMGQDLHMSRDFLLWRRHLYTAQETDKEDPRLTCGCTLLLSGAVADVVGNRTINLMGTFGLSAFILAAGLATSGLQLTIFRAFQGVSSSMCFPTSVSILSAAFPGGRIRNIAFGFLGFRTPLGFAMGILIGGWFESTSIRWRPGLYCTAAIGMTLFAVNCWCLPYERRKNGASDVKQHFKSSRTSKALASTPSARHDPSIRPVDARAGKKRKASSDSKLALEESNVLNYLCNGTSHVGNFAGYQRVQHLSPIETAVRYMPNIVARSTLNILTGLIVHRIAVNRYVVVISGLCSVSPLLMAVIHVDWSWWLAGFWVNLLLPISVDVNYTVANLLITDIFPKETQALAGAVYQMMSQLGISIGIAVLAVISNTIIDRSSMPDKESPEALMQGFRAVFWTCFVMMVLSTLVGMWGLRGWKEIGMTESSEQAIARGERLTCFHSMEGAQHLAVERNVTHLESPVKAPPSSGLALRSYEGPDLTDRYHIERSPGHELPTIKVSSFEKEFSSLDFGANVTLDYKLDAIE